MVMGVCVQCGQPVGNTSKPCPHCGIAVPVPARPILHCTTCHGIVEERHSSCPHCGAPDPAVAAAARRRLGRCCKCGHAVSLAASQCVRCLAPRQADGDDKCPRCGRAKQPCHTSCEVCAGQATPLPIRNLVIPTRCGQCGTELSHVGVRCLRCNPLPPPAAVVGPARQDPSDAGQGLPASPPISQPAALPDKCVVCGKLVAHGVKPCPMCGTPDPTDARAHALRGATAPPRTLQGGSQVLTAMIAVICMLTVAVLLLASHTASDGSRRQRVREAFGDQATEVAMAQLEQEAEELAVSTDAMIKVRFACLRREIRRPPLSEMKAARDRAVGQGRSPDDAVVDVARAACR